MAGFNPDVTLAPVEDGANGNIGDELFSGLAGAAVEEVKDVRLEEAGTASDVGPVEIGPVQLAS